MDHVPRSLGLFKKTHLLEVGLTQNRETMALQALTTVELFYFIMCEDPIFIEIHRNMRCVSKSILKVVRNSLNCDQIFFERTLGSKIGFAHGSCLSKSRLGLCKVGLIRPF